MSDPIEPGSAPFAHDPVMVDRIVELFGPVPAGVVLDATVGGGGHARALLEAHGQLSLVGLDRDREALAAAAETLAPFGDRVTLHHTRFDRLTETLAVLGHDEISGALFDLGVSSPQFDRPGRGFSYRHEASLDMRMDRSQALTAHDVVNTYDEADLIRVLREYGDERYATRIARAIVNARPVETTVELADVVRDAIPAPARRRGGHPARRTFQAVRIEVNDELAILAPSIDAAVDLLVPGGRAAVLAYHSGEDRIVKERFRRAATGGCSCPAGLPCTCGARPSVRLLKAGAWKATPAEVTTNPRAGSARLRAAEKLATDRAGEGGNGEGGRT
ncbi:MAG: 16S rRNA (cytosine(1402)-N(4))-methyltransferase RsmH [Acidimicrobiales bacterium]